MNGLAVIGQARNFHSLLKTANLAVANLFAHFGSGGLLYYNPFAELMRYDGAYFTLFDKLAAGLAVGIAGVAALGAGCGFGVFKLGFAYMVLGVLGGYNCCDFVLCVLIGVKLLADGAFPILDAALRNAGGCFCGMVNELVTESRSIDGLNLLFKAVDVGAEFCGELNLALFGAGRLFESLGGDSCIFGVNMAVVVLADYLSGEGAVVCAPLVGGLAPLMTDCRDFNSLFGRCELGKGCNELALALCFAGCLLNNAVNGVYGFGFGVVRIAFAGMLCGNFAVIAVPSVLGFAPVVLLFIFLFP